MLVESGMVLALQGDKVKVGGGLFTPAACQVNFYPKLFLYSRINNAFVSTLGSTIERPLGCHRLFFYH